MFEKSLIWRSSYVLDRNDRFKATLICVAYALMGILDVIAVFTFGIVGSLAVSGVASNQPGNRVSAILRQLGLENQTLQYQVACLGLGASVILISKSLIALFLTRKIMIFLSRKSALVSKRLISQVLNQDLISIREKTIQETIYTVTTGVNTVVVGVFGSALLLASDVFLLILFGITLFFVDTNVAITSLIFFAGLGVALYRYIHIRATTLGESATKLGILSSDKISEVVSCYRELLVKNRRNYYSQEIGRMRLSIAEAGAKLSVMNLLSKYIMEIAIVVGGLFVGALQFLTQPATRAVAVISVFLVSSARIVPGVLRVQSGVVGIKTAIATAKPTLELIEKYLKQSSMHTQEAVEPYLGNYFHTGFSGSISISNLSFQYPTRRSEALKNFSLNVTPGEFIGIVGPSGSGKSTLVDLMLGILKSESGLIKISGLEPSHAIKKWPGSIGYVPQEANFINGSIKDNVCLGFDPNQVPDTDILPILQSVQLNELIALPDGIRTSVGERGNKLSGGQRQRLGIARALLTNPQLLILDEATSSLDAGTESKITEYFDQLKHKLTLIVIAHRLSTVRNADRIVYLNHGNVEGVGNFDELRQKLPAFDAQARAMGIS